MKIRQSGDVELIHVPFDAEATHEMSDELLRFNWDRLRRVIGQGESRDSIKRLSARLKDQPQDFVVEEVPLYEPSGEGEHLYLWIEKTDFTASQLAGHIGNSIGIRPREIGIAGRKDRRAVTRQYVSIPAAYENQVPAIDNDQVRVLRQKRHSNKLRTGHLQGNRFVIRIRNIQSAEQPATEDLETNWRAAAEALQKTGIPNYFGQQRFGNFGDTAIPGMAMIRPDEYSGTQQPRSHHSKRLFLSAVQSAVFNHLLSLRINAGCFARVLDGDVVQFDKSKSIFTVEDHAAEEPRFQAQDLVTTGPMWGAKMPRPKGRPGQMESQALADCGLNEDDFTRYRKMLPGTRRPLRVIPKDFTIDFEGDCAVFSFYLPSGSYATVLLREFLHNWTSAEDGTRL
jgi:tRNA pseudouridine13 synthase